MKRKTMTRKTRRLVLIGSALAVIFLAVGLVSFALRDNLVFFYGPTELAQKIQKPGARLRVGGLVKEGSVIKDNGRQMTFIVTDMKTDVKVQYTGQVPDLFREGQGVIAEGVMDAAGNIQADTVLAKHDEKYMPRDVADSLKKQGLWKEGTEAAPAPLRKQ